MKSTFYASIICLATLLFSLDSPAQDYAKLTFLESESEKNNFCSLNECGSVFVFDYDYNFYNREVQNAKAVCLIFGCDLLSSMVQTPTNKTSTSVDKGLLYVVNYRSDNEVSNGATSIEIKSAANIYEIIDMCYAETVTCSKLTQKHGEDYKVTTNTISGPSPSTPPLKPGEKPPEGSDDGF